MQLPVNSECCDGRCNGSGQLRWLGCWDALARQELMELRKLSLQVRPLGLVRKHPSTSSRRDTGHALA
jgi:hypothetical protein